MGLRGYHTYDTVSYNDELQKDAYISLTYPGGTSRPSMGLPSLVPSPFFRFCFSLVMARAFPRLKYVRHQSNYNLNKAH